MRIKNHPILTFEEKKKLKFLFDGKKVFGFEGDTVASALHALGVKELSRSIEKNRPRGFYCAIGNCASCNMIVNGVPNVRTCVTLLKEDMDVKTQTNRGELYAH
ncbi:MAG: (2Fe-2S)-binding protein [Candidatus Izemoplasma sp.]